MSTEPNSHHHHHHHGKDDAFSPENYEKTGNIVEAGRIWSESVIEKFHLTTDMLVIDFGSGTGIIGRNLLKNCKKVVFEDISEPMLNQCKKYLEQQEHKNYEVFCGEIKDYEGEKADVVVSSLALHHAGTLATSLKAILSKLKPKGKLAVCEFVFESPEERKAKGKKIPHPGYVPEEFVKCVQDCGFINIELKPANSVVFPNEDGVDETIERFSVFAEAP